MVIRDLDLNITHPCFSLCWQVNLDFDTRESISQNLQQPTPLCFAAAQRKIYGLMENSSFPRFVQSEQYKVLVQVQAGLAGFGRKQKGL